MEQIEDNKEYSVGVTIQGDNTWFMLHYSSTDYFDKLNGDEAIEIFERASENIKQRLKQRYGKN